MRVQSRRSGVPMGGACANQCNPPRDWQCGNERWARDTAALFGVVRLALLAGGLIALAARRADEAHTDDSHVRTGGAHFGGIRTKGSVARGAAGVTGRLEADAHMAIVVRGERAAAPIGDGAAVIP